MRVRVRVGMRWYGSGRLGFSGFLGECLFAALCFTRIVNRCLLGA